MKKSAQYRIDYGIFREPIFSSKYGSSLKINVGKYGRLIKYCRILRVELTGASNVASFTLHNSKKTIGKLIRYIINSKTNPLKKMSNSTLFKGNHTCRLGELGNVGLFYVFWQCEIRLGEMTKDTSKGKGFFLWQNILCGGIFMILVR